MASLPIALGALAAATIAPSSEVVPDHAAACHTRDLSAHLRPGSPGAGQRYATLRLANRSSTACTLTGFAGAQLLRGDGRPLPTRIVRDRSRPPRTVTLQPGEHASARWHWGAVPGAGEPTDGPCQPTARRILITPPDETRPLRLRWRLGKVCRHGRIEERPFRAAS
jgi:Protein of unknown function (DUF4232)